MLTKLLPILGGLLAGGGLQEILAGLQQQGLGAQANSWAGTGANEPETGDQVAKVLGDQEIGQIAQQLGVSNEEAAGELAPGSAAGGGQGQPGRPAPVASGAGTSVRGAAAHSGARTVVPPSRWWVVLPGRPDCGPWQVRP
jgi:hypothetical protein